MEPLSPSQLRTARFKIIRNMLQDDPQLKELVKEYLGIHKKTSWIKKPVAERNWIKRAEVAA